MLFGRVKNSKKVTLESLGGPFCRNMAPKRGPKRLPKSTKNGPDLPSLWNTLIGGPRAPKSFQKRSPSWPQNFQLFKLKSDFDLLLEASWDPLGTILGDFWGNFGNFLATCLASRFGIDFWCFFDAFKSCFFDSRRGENAFFTFSSGSMLASILASKTFPKWTQNGPKTVPRGSQRLLKKFSKNACFSEG